MQILRRKTMSKNTSNTIKGAVAFAATFGICYLTSVDGESWKVWHTIAAIACGGALIGYLIHMFTDK